MPLESAIYYSDGIVGSNTKAGRADSSVVVEFSHEVYSPVDTQMGTISGARVHGAAVVMKEVDAATAPLYQACCTGQTLEELRVEWFRINPQGQEELYFTHTLSNVKVASVEILLPNTKDPSREQYRHLEKLQLLYEKMNWKHEDGYEYEDSWAEP